MLTVAADVGERIAARAHRHGDGRDARLAFLDRLAVTAAARDRASSRLSAASDVTARGPRPCVPRRASRATSASARVSGSEASQALPVAVACRITPRPASAS